MNQPDYDRLSSLAAMHELPGEREDFLESLIPFYEMMEKVRHAVLEDAPDLERDTDEPVLNLREDEICEFSAPEKITEQSERRDGSCYTVPRSI